MHHCSGKGAPIALIQKNSYIENLFPIQAGFPGSMRQGSYPKVLKLALVLLFCGTLVFRVLSWSELTTSPLDQATIFRFTCVVLSASIALCFATLKRLSLRALFKTPAVRWCAVYAIIGAIGSFISPYPLMSLYKAAEFLMLCVITVICTEGGFRMGRQFTPLTLMYICLACLACTIFFGGIVFPQQAWHWYPSGWHWQLEGVFPLYPANAVGELGAILFLVSFGFWLKTRRFLWIPLILLSFILCLGGYSRTSLLALPLSLLFLVRLRHPSAIVPVFIVSFLAATSYFLFGDWVLAALLRGQTVHEFSLLSERVNWWKLAIDQFWRSPLLGSGFGNVGSRYFVFHKIGLETTGAMHSAYVQALLETGILGTLFYLAMIICGLRFCVATAWMARPPVLCAVNAGIVCIVIVRSLTSSALVAFTPSLILFLLIMSAHQRKENRM
jgi:O-antigen ligase